MGRHVFGLSALVLGVIALLWPGSLLIHAAGAAQIAGGALIQFRPTARPGAFILAAVYVVLSLLLVPPILATPRIFDPWGDFFEEFALVAGASLVFFRLSPGWASQSLPRLGRILFAVCAVSFALYQAVHLDFTATLVPKWLPPSQMFWSVTTTVLFGLAAVALLLNQAALLASRLMTLMLVLFGLLVWVPQLISKPHSHGNWSEAALTFAIAGAVWILADLLDAYRSRQR